MKVAVTSQGVSLDAEVDLRFGRAEQFIVYDTETEKFQVISNSQNLNAAKGAGIQAAETLSRLDVDCLISGHCGPNAYRTLVQPVLQYIPGQAERYQTCLRRWQQGNLHRQKQLIKPATGYDHCRCIR